MIVIKLSFLLAFPLISEEPPKQANDQKIKIDAKSKKDKASKKGSAKVKPVKEKPPPPERPKYVIPVGKPMGSCNIEYELIPGRSKYKIDIICWGPVAKIYSADGEIVIKTYIVGELAWVSISLKHVLHSLPKDDLLQMHSHVINYVITTGKKKLGANAKKEKAKEFYLLNSDVDSISKFVEAYSTDPNLEEQKDKNTYTARLETFMEEILWECAETPGSKDAKEIVSLLLFSADSLHKFQVDKILNSLNLGQSVECKDFVPICPPPLPDEEDLKKEDNIKVDTKKGKDKNKKKPEKAAKKGKEKKAGPPTIFVPGEVFFTDSYLSIYDLKDAPFDLPKAFVITTAQNFMTRSQKYALNPLIIKIKKLANLPVETLQKHRFRNIDIRYNIPYVAQCTTICKPLAKKIKFNESHAHFTNTVPSIKLIEFLQTQKFYVEVRGHRDEYQETIAPNIFGTEKDDEIFNKAQTPLERLRKKKEEPPLVTIAVACFDTSTLLKPIWNYKIRCVCHNPDNILYQKTLKYLGTFRMLDKMTTNEVNLDVLYGQKSVSPLTEHELFSCLTNLKVEVYLTAPLLQEQIEVHTNHGLYSRLIMIVNDLEIIKALLNSATSHNQSALGAGIYYANCLKSNHHRAITFGPGPSKHHSSDTTRELAITGFMVDNGSSAAFYLEGPSFGFMSNIWSQVMSCNNSAMKIFYNSDFCFEKRLYAEFLHFGGIIPVTLFQDFNKTLRRGPFYVQGNVPIPAFKVSNAFVYRAFQKLDLLFKSNSIKTIIQYNLLPTPTELLSISIEFGVPPIYHKRRVNDKTEIHSDHLEPLENKDVEEPIEHLLQSVPYL